ncbi:MAG: PqqD family protein [Candidatus Omnitrophica bacterium]|nr:PqqD family protein [Candidatus Omnitrophota bacterium]MBU4479632.1 PqqD family protein [Candidatus Omnitrophota bacterium]MCG2703540.1 PqqD family protein [Candidatus Omnitrophota bacterium]
MLEKCYEKCADMVERKIADEFILVPIRHKTGDLECIYALNPVSSRIWELIDGKKSVSQIRDVIADEFDVQVQEAEKDLKEILNVFEKIRGVKEV